MTVNKEEYEKIKYSAILCSLRKQYIQTLSNVNQALGTVFFDDKGFLEYYRKSHMHIPGAIIVGILIGILLLPIPSMIAFLLFTYDETKFVLLLFAFSILTIALGGIGGYFFAVSSINQKAQKELREYAKTREEAYKMRPELLKAQTEYQKKLSDLVAQMNDRNICVIPNNYWDYAPMLVAYIDNCRAHDLESAINVLEQDLHNQRMEYTQLMSYMEQMQTRILNEQIAEDASAAREAAEQAEINSHAAAVYSRQTWYNTL